MRTAASGRRPFGELGLSPRGDRPAAIPPAVARLAEDPGAAGPDPAPTSGFRRVLDDRLCVLFGPVFTSASRIRLGPDEVEPAVRRVRDLTRGQEWETAWWVGGSATPPDLGERLRALGLRPAEDPGWEPAGTAMATVTPPPAGGEATARRVETYAGFVQAAEIAYAAFAVPDEERERDRATLPERWAASRRGEAPESYLAEIDGEPVAAARALFLPEGALLLGGSTLPAARGRGAYRALVRARWDDAVARGTPALAVIAGAMSRPVLERLGFTAVTRIEIFLDGER